MKQVRTLTLPPLLDHQREVLASRDPLILFLGGIGSGKTYGLAHMVLRGVIEQPGCESAIFAPTGPILKRVTLPTIRRCIPPELYTYHPADQEIHWMNGSVTYCIGVDRKPEERIVGMNLAWAVWDEAGASKNGDIIGLVTERLRAGDPEHRFIGLFTSPRGHGWLRRWSSDGVRVIKATVYDNLHLDAAFLTMLERAFPPGTLLHRQELLGEFVSLTGLVYGNLFHRGEHLAPVGYDPTLPYELGWDPGSRASGVVAVQVVGGTHVVVREWTPTGEPTEDTALKIRRDMTKSPRAVYLDTPSRLNTRTNITDTSAIRKAFPGCDVRVLGGKYRESAYRHRAVSQALARRALQISWRLEPDQILGGERGVVHALESLEWPDESTRSEHQDEKSELKHIIDALEFYCAVRIKPRFVSTEERVREYR